MITEVGHVSDGHSGHGERLTIHASEPPGEFAKVVDDRFAGVVGVIIFVFPTFSDLPWYADHPTNPAIRQEMYFMKVVVPFVEASYPASDERLLLGFSKSGWGAWALLLRHPDVFRRAAAWDAPLTMEQVGKFGTSGIFGTQKNFEQYRPADLLRQDAARLRSETRLILTGYDNFRTHHQQAHKLLEDLGIPHEYRDGPQRQHEWHSGWLSEAVDLLLSTSS